MSMRSFLGFIFVMVSPILLGGFLPVVLMDGLHWQGGNAVLAFLVYAVIWFIVWACPLDYGRKIPL